MSNRRTIESLKRIVRAKAPGAYLESHWSVVGAKIYSVLDAWAGIHLSCQELTPLAAWQAAARTLGVERRADDA